MKKFAALLSGLLMMAGVLTGCGSGGGGPLTYAPAAYGENGHCYYETYQDEAVQLLQQGLCPQGWVPYPMPTYWYDRYYPYYSSPAFYNTYVPAQYRTVYVKQTTVYYSTHKSQVDNAEKTAQYKGSNGKVVTNPKVNPGQFSGGQGKGTKYSGGSGKTTGGSSGSTSGKSYSGTTGRTTSRFGGGGGKR